MRRRGWSADEDECGRKHVAGRAGVGGERWEEGECEMHVGRDHWAEVDRT